MRGYDWLQVPLEQLMSGEGEELTVPLPAIVTPMGCEGSIASYTMKLAVLIVFQLPSLRPVKSRARKEMV